MPLSPEVAARNLEVMREERAAQGLPTPCTDPATAAALQAIDQRERSKVGARVVSPGSTLVPARDTGAVAAAPGHSSSA